MDGLHLTADLHDCANNLPEMVDPDALRRRCLEAVRTAGLSAVGELFHRFQEAAPASPHRPPSAGGVTGVVLLAESHLAVHTWPELNAVTLDVYVCNVEADNTGRAETLLATLVSLFQPQHSERQAVHRGRLR